MNRQNLDKFDRSILEILQTDASVSMDSLAEQVHLSRNACWRRVRNLEEAGVITGRVALVNPDAIGLGQTVFLMIRTSEHNLDWLTNFQEVVRDLPQVVSAHRMTGDLDYVLRVRVADVKDYDRFYKTLVSRVAISDISASFVMEDIKDTTWLPVSQGT